MIITFPYDDVTDEAALTLHPSAVPDTQDVVAHVSTPVTDADGVQLVEQKFRPEIVTTAPPAGTPLPGVYALATGAASNRRFSSAAAHSWQHTVSVSPILRSSAGSLCQISHLQVTFYSTYRRR